MGRNGIYSNNIREHMDLWDVSGAVHEALSVSLQPPTKTIITEHVLLKRFTTQVRWT